MPLKRVISIPPQDLAELEAARKLLRDASKQVENLEKKITVTYTTSKELEYPWYSRVDGPFILITRID